MSDLPLVGVSACLLGQRVRWDGGHKRSDPVVEIAERVELVPVCPEDEVGMGTPREPIKLDPERRLVGARSGTDHTDAMNSWADRRLSELADLDGFVLKADSPSCGLKRVRVQGKGRIGRGAFAERLVTTRPNLPVCQEGDVDDHFIELVYAHARWRERRREGEKLHEFHARHKFQLLAHSEKQSRELGRRVAEGMDEDDYAAAFFRTLQLRPTRAKHANVLQHLMGFVKRDIDADDKKEILEAIGSYRAKKTSIDAPIALISHHLRKNPNVWAQAQSYLRPYSF